MRTKRRGDRSEGRRGAAGEGRGTAGTRKSRGDLAADGAGNRGEERLNLSGGEAGTGDHGNGGELHCDGVGWVKCGWVIEVDELMKVIVWLWMRSKVRQGEGSFLYRQHSMVLAPH